MTRTRSVVIPLCAFVVIALAGAAFIRLEAGKRVAEQRAEAAQISMDCAHAIKKRIDGISEAVYFLVAEIDRSGNASDFRTLAAKTVQLDTSPGQLWLVSGNRVLDSYPTTKEGSGTNQLPVDEWTEESAEGRSFLVRGAASVDIDQMTSGEWAIIIRVPLLLNDQGRGRNPVAWVAGSFPLEELYRESGIARLPATGWDYQFSASGPAGGRAHVLAASAQVDFNDAVEQILDPGESRWTLKVRPRNGWSLLPRILIHFVSSSFSLWRRPSSLTIRPRKQRNIGKN